jgi:hypothetical protein
MDNLDEVIMIKNEKGIQYVDKKCLGQELIQVTFGILPTTKGFEIIDSI